MLLGVIAASFAEQLSLRQLPCAYCLLQRSMMLCIVTAVLMNFRFGIQVKHYALMLFSALLGGAISLVQTSLHVCPDFPKFGVPVLGLSLYVWAFIVFVASVLSISTFLFLHTPEMTHRIPLNLFEKGLFCLALLATALLAGLTFNQCGFGDCQGTVPSVQNVEEP